MNFLVYIVKERIFFFLNEFNLKMNEMNFKLNSCKCAAQQSWALAFVLRTQNVVRTLE